MSFETARDASQSIKYKNLREFWPFYLSQHSVPRNRRLHFYGTTIVLFLIVAFILNPDWRIVVAGFVVGYGFAWVGHFFVEKNKPATFKYPILSLISDWRLWAEMLLGRHWK